MSERKYITFTKKQIASITDHRTIIDSKTNQPMKMYAIKLPSKNYRNTIFEKDNKGIDRNNRAATISIGAPYIKQNDDEGLYYTYPQKDRLYTVCFKGKVVGKDNGKNIFDKPEPLKLTGEELIKIFNEAYEISKKKKLQIKKEKESKKNKNQHKDLEMK